MYFVSIDAGTKWPLFYSHVDPVWSLLNIGIGCHVIVTGCILGRAPRKKETLPDFHEWFRVTRHPQVFRGLTGCQRTPRFWGVAITVSDICKLDTNLIAEQEL